MKEEYVDYSNFDNELETYLVCPDCETGFGLVLKSADEWVNCPDCGIGYFIDLV